MTEVFKAFLKLGLTAFGGPTAHIGFFHTEFVRQRRWLSDNQFSQLLAICQFLPGPASSQLGFAIGLSRAGWSGALAAFVAFTLPSAVALYLFAQLTVYLDNAVGAAVIQGLKLVAVAVVAHAIWTMSKSLTPDWTRRFMAVAACLVLLLTTGLWLQFVLLLSGAMLGLWLCQPTSLNNAALSITYRTRLAWAFALIFSLLFLLSLILISSSMNAGSLFAHFYKAGALVFGGGHVVLPFLENSLVNQGCLTSDKFVAGYGAAQAVPGPLFTFASYLGAEVDTGLPSALNALIATLAIFLPGFLLLLAFLPFWTQITARPRATAAIAGINATVVGLLAAAFIDPIVTSALHRWPDLLIAVGGFILLSFWRCSALWVVGFCVLLSVAFYGFSPSLLISLP